MQYIPIKQSCVHKFCQSISTKCCRLRIQTSRYRFFRCHHYTSAERIFQCLLITPAGIQGVKNSFWKGWFSHSKWSTQVSSVHEKLSCNLQWLLVFWNWRVCFFSVGKFYVTQMKNSCQNSKYCFLEKKVISNQIHSYITIFFTRRREK